MACQAYVKTGDRKQAGSGSTSAAKEKKAAAKEDKAAAKEDKKAAAKEEKAAAKKGNQAIQKELKRALKHKRAVPTEKNPKEEKKAAAKADGSCSRKRGGGSRKGEEESIPKGYEGSLDTRRGSRKGGESNNKTKHGGGVTELGSLS